MNNLENVQLVVQEKQPDRTREARKQMARNLMRGKLPTLEETAEARGLVVRERDNSIFSDAWVPLAVVFLIAGFTLGRNTAALALGAALLLVVWVSTWWKNNALINVTYERHFDRTHVFPGEPVEMTLHILNQKTLPLTWLQFQDDMPIAPEEASSLSKVQGETTGRYVLQNTFSMAGHERKKRTFTLMFGQRGFKQLGPVRYNSGDIFTLFTTQQMRDYRDTLVVYPQIWSLTELGLPAKELFGPLTTRHSLFTDPIKTQGIRDYQPQDRFRDVHWKATARRGSLQTKVYDPSTGMTVVIFLNVATMPKHWQGHFPALLERAVSVAGSIASFASEQKWGLGLYANGSVPKSDQPIRVPPGRAPEQLMHVLEALAAVTEFATGSIELLMQRESPRLPWAATLVLVTAVLTEEMLVGLMRLKEAGRRIALLYLGEDAPSFRLDGIAYFHLPGSMPAFHAPSQTATLDTIPTPTAIPDAETIRHGDPQGA